jgi:hypothetical protein
LVFKGLDPDRSGKAIFAQEVDREKPLRCPFSDNFWPSKLILPKVCLDGLPFFNGASGGAKLELAEFLTIEAADANARERR